MEVMEMDFQLTEDKKALDQLEAARTGMSWYSGSVYGISLQIPFCYHHIFCIIETNILAVTKIHQLPREIAYWINRTQLSSGMCRLSIQTLTKRYLTM